MEIVFVALFIVTFLIIVSKTSGWLRLNTLKSPMREFGSFAAFFLALLIMAAALALAMIVLFMFAHFR